MNNLLFNIFDNLCFSEKEEILNLIYEDDSLKIIRILSLNQITKVYDQEELEIVLLFDGEASIKFDDEIVDLKKGDVLKIPPHTKHKVIKQKRAVWFCVFKK